jgi:hypothetical protein
MVRGSQSSLRDAPVSAGDGQLRLKLGDLVAQSSVLGQQQDVALAKWTPQFSESVWAVRTP